MKKLIRYMCLAGCGVIAALGITACNDDNDPVSEWEADYLYIERPSLGVSVVKMALQHLPSGISGPGEFPVTVKLSHAQTFDVHVYLATEVGSGLAPELVSFRNGGEIVIPAGETSGSDVLRFDYARMSDVPQTAQVYQLSVSIKDASGLSDRLRLSTKLSKIDFQLDKSLYSNALYDTTPQGVSIADRSGWVVKVLKQFEDTGNWVEEKKLTDGSTSTNMYTFYYCGISIDLGEARMVTGIQNHRGSNKNFSASECWIETSEDGESWAKQHDRAAISRDEALQSIAFIEPVKARFIRLHLYAAQRITSTEIYVWEVSDSTETPAE